LAPAGGAPEDAARTSPALEGLFDAVGDALDHTQVTPHALLGSRTTLLPVSDGDDRDSESTGECLLGEMEAPANEKDIRHGFEL